VRHLIVLLAAGLLVSACGETPRPVGWDGRFSRSRQAERLVAELQQLERRAMPRVSGV